MQGKEKANNVGEKVVEVLRSRNIVIRHLLQKIQNDHPEMRGLTENGFRLSINKGTIKVSVLERISEEIGIPMSVWFDDYGNDVAKKLENFESGPEKYLIETLGTLRKANEQMEEKIKLLEALLGDKLPYKPKDPEKNIWNPIKNNA